MATRGKGAAAAQRSIEEGASQGGQEAQQAGNHDGGKAEGGGGRGLAARAKVRAAPPEQIEEKLAEEEGWAVQPEKYEGPAESRVILAGRLGALERREA